MQSRTLTRPFSLGIGVRLNTYSDSIGPVWSPIPHALNPTGPSSAAIQRPPSRQHRFGGRAAARSRNTSSKPRGYPFKLKAALASPLVAGEWAIPVLCGPATGADAPKSFRGDGGEPIVSQRRPQRATGRLTAAPNQCAGLLAGPNAERRR